MQKILFGTGLSLNFEETVLKALREKDYRITGPRALVARTLEKADKALSAYDIHASIKDSGHRCDVVSVYRILTTFEECGLIYRIRAFDGVFRRTIQPQHGGSFLVVNVDTREVAELPDNVAVARLVDAVRPQLPGGLKIVGHHLEVVVQNA